MTCFRPRKCLLGVTTMGDVIWGKYSPKTPQKGPWIGSFKPKRQNLYIAISPELLIRRSSDLRTEFRPRKALRGWSAITPKQIQHGWRRPLENRYDVIFQWRMCRFGRNWNRLKSRRQPSSIAIVKTVKTSDCTSDSNTGLVTERLTLRICLRADMSCHGDVRVQVDPRVTDRRRRTDRISPSANRDRRDLIQSSTWRTP